MLEYWNALYPLFHFSINPALRAAQWYSRARKQKFGMTHLAVENLLI